MPLGIYKRTKQHSLKISLALKGKHNSPSTEFQKGHIGYGLGKKRKPFSKKWKRNISESAKKRIRKPNFRHNTKGRFKNSGGYILVYSPNHPNKDKKRYVLEHRLIMEEKIGRYLGKKEEVHHIDQNKTNNDISNLILFTSKSEHMRHHRAKSKGKTF